MKKTFKANTQWMAEKYEEMNQKLFNGLLGNCNFEVFTKGKGSEGRTLGWFTLKGSNLMVERYNRKIVKKGVDKVYIDRNNFFELCCPTIGLNGNYCGTEHAFLGTLVHEMCHYYTYMDGYYPRQGHGYEFKHIGSIVSVRSNGMFTIQRLATAEEMLEYELCDKMKAKREKRLANKKANALALFNYKKNGQIQLSITSSNDVIREVVETTKAKNDAIKIEKSNDQELIEKLFSLGYKRTFRTWRYWNVADTNWIVPLMNHGFKIERIYTNPIKS